MCSIGPMHAAEIFSTEDEYPAFKRILEEAFRAQTVKQFLGYCVMPDHWHLVVWPRNGKDRQVSEFLRWLTVTHTQRWHAHRHTTGTGHLYQGRFKSFPVESDEHLYAVLRYVERNPVRANLVQRAQDWRWSSTWRRHRGDEEARRLLSPWPMTRPTDWLRRVNRAERRGELEALRRMRAARPAVWQRASAPTDHCDSSAWNRPSVPAEDLVISPNAKWSVSQITSWLSWPSASGSGSC